MLPSIESIQRATEIVRQIEELQAELVGLFVAGKSKPAKAAKVAKVAAPAAAARRGRPPAAGKSRRKMSEEGRARIAAAAKARWAKFRAERKKSAA